MSKELEALERLYCSGNLQLDYVLSNKHKQDYDTIEQALLKAQEQEKVLNEALKLNSEWAEELDYYKDLQEPKKYLKWEDLEFDRKEKIIKVKLGDNVYHLIVGLTIGGNNLVTFLTELKHHYFNDTDKQFFNDLHLERVE